VVADRSESAPELVGGGRIGFAVERGMQSPRESVEQLGDLLLARPTRFALQSFDAERPKLELCSSEGEGALEVYDAPAGGPKTPEACAARARLWREAASARRARAQGLSTSARIAPGRRLTIEGHPIDRFCGGFFATQVQIEIIQRRRDQAASDERPFRCRFQALREDVPFRCEPLTPPAQQAGLQTAFVVGSPSIEVYPDETARVRVQFAWDREGQRDERAGCWTRVVQRGTAESLMLPRVGWTVMTANEEGAVDEPVVLSRIFDAEHPPPYELPGNKTRTTYKTATTPGGGSFNELHFEDNSGAEVMHINAARDMNVLVQNAKTEHVKANVTRHVGNDHELEVGNDAGESIAGNQTVSIAKNETEKVGASRALSVTGSETGTIGAGRKLEIEGVYEDTVTGTRQLKVGTAQLDTSIGNISSGSQLGAVVVGGAMLRTTIRDITESVGTTVSMSDAADWASSQVEVDGVAGQVVDAVASKVSSKLSEYSTPAGGVLQAVGIAKVELATAERTISTEKAYDEAVAGSMRLEAATLTDEATESYQLTAKDVSLYAKQDCVLEAESLIELSCGSSSLTIDEEGVVLHGAKVELDGEKLEAKSARIDLNE